MAQTITDLMVLKQATCPHWVYFDLRGDESRKGEWQPALFAGRLADEKALVESRGQFEQPAGDSPEDRASAALELMKRGAERIYRPVIVLEVESDGADAGRRYVAEPDLLEKRPGSSALGAYHYVALDVRGGERVTEALKDKAAFYGEVLRGIQGHRPEQGYVLTASGALFSFDLAEQEERLFRLLDEIEAVFAGEVPPPHVGSACKRSPWFGECIRLAEAKDDIALLYNVKKKYARELRSAGFETVSDVRRMDVTETAARHPFFSERFLERVKLQAEALKSRRHFMREPYSLPETPVEVFFDIEADPSRSIDYLYGFVVRDSKGVRYEKFLAESPEQEKEMWKSFLRWYGQMPPETFIYHFGNYERQSLAVLESRYGGSKPLTRFRRQMRDLNEIVKDSVVFPLYFYGLKDIGCYIGYERSCGIAGGAQSVDVFDDWLTTGDRSKLEQIIEYNREDCEATMALKDWLAEESAGG